MVIVAPAAALDGVHVSGCYVVVVDPNCADLVFAFSSVTGRFQSPCQQRLEQSRFNWKKQRGYRGTLSASRPLAGD